MADSYPPQRGLIIEVDEGGSWGSEKALSWLLSWTLWGRGGGVGSALGKPCPLLSAPPASWRPALRAMGSRSRGENPVDYLKCHVSPKK